MLAYAQKDQLQPSRKKHEATVLLRSACFFITTVKQSPHPMSKIVGSSKVIIISIHAFLILIMYDHEMIIVYNFRQMSLLESLVE